MILPLLLSIGAASAAPQDSAPASRGTAKPGVRGDLGRKLDDYLKRLAPFGFSGTLVVEKDGEVVLHAGYGFADHERKIPMAPEAVLPIGSITKQFTAAAILKLEMLGKVRTNDPISKYFPNVPADKGAITLHHLLIHGAGLESDYGDGDFEPVTREEIVRRVLAAPLRSTPGATYHYSNAGYSLLAAIVEQVSGKSHEEYLYENLWKPAGMEKTGFRRPRWEPGELARGLRNGREWGTILERPAAADGPYWNLRGNGGIHSTGGDMWLWHRALEGDAILSKDAKKKFFTPYIPEDGGESQYAYGWAIFETPRRTRLIAHNGGDGIFAADDRWYPDDGLFYYIASNADLPAIAVSERIARLCFVGKGSAAADVVMPPEVVSPAAAAPGAAGDKGAKLAGDYRLDSGGRVALRATGGGLALAADSALLFETLFPMPPRFAGLGRELAQRTQQILEASRKGDSAPLCRAIGDGAPPEQVAQREADRWVSIAKSCGAIRSVTILGARPSRGGAVATVARIDGERATAYRSFVWEDDALAELATLDGPPEAAFLPDATGGYVAFDFWNGNTVTIASMKIAPAASPAAGADAGSIEIVTTNPKGAPLTKLRANRAR